MEPKVLQAIQQVVENQDLLRRIKDEFQGMKPQNELKAKIGPFGSGASVLADSLAIQDVKEHARKLLGFDMEAYAVMLAGTISSDLSSYPIVIKSVSDFGTEEKGDEYQEYAAYTSARLIPPLLEQLFPN